MTEFKTGDRVRLSAQASWWRKEGVLDNEGTVATPAYLNGNVYVNWDGGGLNAYNNPPEHEIELVPVAWERRQDEHGRIIEVQWGDSRDPYTEHTVRYPNDDNYVSALSRNYIEEVYTEVVPTTDPVQLLRNNGYSAAANFLNEALNPPKTHKVLVEFELEEGEDITAILDRTDIDYTIKEA